MKKILIIVSCLAITIVACEKNKPESKPQPGNTDGPVTPPAVEYLDLLVTAPAFMADGWTKTLDTIYVSTGGYKLYPYYATESGSPARFTSAVEKSGIIKAAKYSLNISLGDDSELEIPAEQTIAGGENTTEMPCIARCIDKAANADGLLEIAFSTSSGTKIILNFENEPFTLNTLSLKALGGESLIGQSESVQLTFQDGLDLSAGGKAPIFVTPVEELSLSQGLLAIANEDTENEVVRIILGGQSLSFSDSESGPYTDVNLDKWKLGGIASADDLVAFSYCSAHGRTLSHFVTETDSDPDITLTAPAKKVKLLGDIDMAGREWQPILHFTGIFDGDGHTIDNLVYSFDGVPTQLVFTKTSSGTSKPRELFCVSGFIDELGEDSADADADASILRDITFGPGCQFNLRNTKEIPEWRYGATGGIIARVGYNSVLKNVKNKAKIDIIITEGKANANIFAGGTVGLFNGSLIDGCTIEGPLGFCLPGSGSIWMNSLAIGGICGTATSDTWVPVTVSNCSVKATASMYVHIRTLVNYLMETDLYAVGNFGRCCVGGVIGSIAEISGINKDNAKILNCSNEAPISAGWWGAKNNVPLQAYPAETDDIAYERNVVTNLGGIVGLIGDKTRNRAATVRDCSNSGKILLTGFSQKKQEVHSTAGGIVGLALTDASVFAHLENTGAVVLHGQQTGFVGGIIGCLVPASASGDNAYLGGNPSSVEYLHNAGNVYICGTKTYFKHSSPNIALGGLFGLVSGQVLESGSPLHQRIVHCYNEGEVFSACKGNDDNPATNVAFDLGGIAGRIGSCAFEDVINFGKVYTSKEHACEVGGFIGSVFEKAKTKQGGTVFSPVFQASFKDCGQYGDVIAVTPAHANVRMGIWDGWCAFRGAQFSTSGNSGNKTGCSFGEYDGVQTAIVSDNYATAVVRGNVAADKTSTIRLFNGPDDSDPEPDELWNSFSYGAVPAKPTF